MPDQHYALHDPDTGRWFFRTPPTPYTHASSDHAPVTTINGDRADTDGIRAGWCATAPGWTGDPVTAEVTVTYRTRQPVIGYRLMEPYRGAAALPERLTPEEFRAAYLDDLTPEEFRAAYLDGDEVGAGVLYEIEWGEPGVDQVTAAGPRLILDGAPRPSHIGVWTAELPRELTTHPEYTHLFPGTLSGIHGHLVDQHDTGLFGRGVKVYPGSPGDRRPLSIHVPSTVSDPRPARPGAGRKQRQIAEQANRREIRREWPGIPDRIQAADLAAAAATAAELVADVTAWIEEAKAGRWCSCCDGTGIVAAGAP